VMLVSPVNGHQVTGTEEHPDYCMIRIRDAWLNDPASDLDTTCASELHLDYGIPPPTV
jgi:hypothetical protein